MKQGTYSLIVKALRPESDQWARTLDVTRARLLLEAYEEAIRLLDQAQNAGINHPTVQRQVEEFLYLDNGEPRVTLEDP
jgi:uncharacterized protein HemY